MVVAEDQHGLTARFRDKSIANLDTESIEAGWEDLLQDSFSELSVTPDEGVAVDSDTFLQAILSGRDDITEKREAAVCLCYLEKEGAISLDNGTVVLFPSDLDDSNYSSKMAYNIIAYLEAQADRWSYVIEQYDNKLEKLDDLIDEIDDDGFERQERINQLEGEIMELCGDLIPPESATRADSVAESEYNLRNKVSVPDEVEQKLNSENIKRYKMKWSELLELKKKNGPWGPPPKLLENTFEVLLDQKERTEQLVKELEKQKIPQLRKQVTLGAVPLKDAVEDVTLDLDDLMQEQAEVMDWYDQCKKTAETEIESNEDILETYQQGIQAEAEIQGIEPEEVEKGLGDEEGIGNLSSSPSG